MIIQIFQTKKEIWLKKDLYSTERSPLSKPTRFEERSLLNQHNFTPQQIVKPYYRD